MPKSTARYCLAASGAVLMLGSSCYVAYRAGQGDSLRRAEYEVQSEGRYFQQVAQHSKSSSIALRAEHDEDGPYIVVVIPWRTLCASGLKLPQEQAEDCADAKASKSPDVTYILPTDDDNDDDSGATNRETSLHVSSDQ